MKTFIKTFILIFILLYVALVVFTKCSGTTIISGGDVTIDNSTYINK